jgi:hypothetical protein
MTMDAELDHTDENVVIDLTQVRATRRREEIDSRRAHPSYPGDAPGRVWRVLMRHELDHEQWGTTGS